MYLDKLAQLVDMIAAAVNDPQMKKMTTTTITDWLLEKGFLEKQIGPDGKSRRVPTQNGLMIGLTTETRQGQYGEYQVGEDRLRNVITEVTVFDRSI